MKLTKNFSLWEFACRCGSRFCSQQYIQLSLELYNGLQRLRDHYQVPIHIISGVRCPRHDLSKVRPNSKHAKGEAADIVVVDVKPVVVALLIEEQFPEFKGLGCNWARGTVHVDVREEEPCKWTYAANDALLYTADLSSLLSSFGTIVYPGAGSSV